MIKKKDILQVEIGDQLPKHGNKLVRGFMLLILFAIGWKVTGYFPNVPKMVLVGAPHTSNGEGVLTVIISLAMGIRVSWMSKHTLFKRPFGTILRWLGGVPVDRSGPHGTVAQMVQLINDQEKMILAITPEGTRDHVREWKKGFYYIAQGSDVPLVPALFDYAKKEVHFAGIFETSGNYEIDLPLIKAYFEGVVPRHPERA